MTSSVALLFTLRDFVEKAPLFGGEAAYALFVDLVEHPVQLGCDRVGPRSITGPGLLRGEMFGVAGRRLYHDDPLDLALRREWRALGNGLDPEEDVPCDHSAKVPA